MVIRTSSWRRSGYYLNHEEKRARIARAGQARTLREHTYLHRMRELEQLVDAFAHQKG